MLFGIWIAGYRPISDFGFILKAWVGIFPEFLGSFYADHVRFDLCHPYLIILMNFCVIILGTSMFLLVPV